MNEPKLSLALLALLALVLSAPLPAQEDEHGHEEEEGHEGHGHEEGYPQEGAFNKGWKLHFLSHSLLENGRSSSCSPFTSVNMQTSQPGMGFTLSRQRARIYSGVLVSRIVHGQGRLLR